MNFVNARCNKCKRQLYVNYRENLYCSDCQKQYKINHNVGITNIIKNETICIKCYNEKG
jgi:exosome complex RNA-binding protein Csl4